MPKLTIPESPRRPEQPSTGHAVAPRKPYHAMTSDKSLKGLKCYQEFIIESYELLMLCVYVSKYCLQSTTIRLLIPYLFISTISVNNLINHI